MTLPSSTALQVTFAVALVIFTAYAAGRVHQWFRHGFEREVAFREGYNLASHTLFHLAARSLPAADGTSHPADAGSSPQGRLAARTLTGDHHGRGMDPTRFDVAGAR